MGKKSFNGPWINDMQMKEFQKIYLRTLTKLNKKNAVKLVETGIAAGHMEIVIYAILPNNRLMYADDIVHCVRRKK